MDDLPELEGASSFDRRAFIRRCLGLAFVAPTIVSFTLDAFGAPPAAAQLPGNQTGGGTTTTMNPNQCLPNQTRNNQASNNQACYPLPVVDEAAPGGEERAFGAETAAGEAGSSRIRDAAVLGGVAGITALGAQVLRKKGGTAPSDDKRW
jgi:hypothetical protein